MPISAIAWFRQSLGGFQMNFRVLLAFFSAVIAAIAAVLAPVAYFGDKNVARTNRLIWIAFIAGLIFLIVLLW